MKAFLAGDVSKGYADFVLLDQQLRQLQPPIQFDDSRSGHQALEQWLNQAIADAQLTQVYAAVESTGGFEDNWVAMFFQLAQTLPVQVSRLNPMPVAKAAKAEGSMQRTDSLSAYHIAYYQRRYHDKITYQQPQSHYRSFRSLDNHTQLLIRQRTQLINELKQLLYHCMPELLAYCRNSGIPAWMLAVLQKYPANQKIARARAQTLARFDQLSRPKAEQLITKARQSVAGDTDPTDSFLIADQAATIADKTRRIEALKRELMTRCTGPEVALLQTMKGVGAYSAARMMIHIEDIRRFASPKHIASFFGLHPTLQESGDQTSRSRMSKKGDPAVRSTLFMCAQSAVNHDPHLKAIYDKHRQAGKSYFQTIGIIMHKMLRIMWGILTHQKPYDSDTDQQNQQKNTQQPVDQTNAEWRHKRRKQELDEAAPVSRKAYKKRKAYQLSQVSNAEQVRDLTDMPDP